MFQYVMSFQVLLSLVCGVAVAMMAVRKGRNGLLWFLIGAVFTLLGVLMVYLISDPRRGQEAVAELEWRNRQLREQLEEARARAARAGEHPVPSTHAPSVRLAAPIPPPPPPVASNAARPMPTPGTEEPDRVWYHLDGDDARGPLTAALVHRLLGNGEFNGGTLLWSPALGQWTAARHIPLFQSSVRE